MLKMVNPGQHRFSGMVLLVLCLCLLFVQVAPGVLMQDSISDWSNHNALDHHHGGLANDMALSAVLVCISAGIFVIRLFSTRYFVYSIHPVPQLHPPK